MVAIRNHVAGLAPLCDDFFALGYVAVGVRGAARDQAGGGCDEDTIKHDVSSLGKSAWAPCVCSGASGHVPRPCGGQSKHSLGCTDPAESAHVKLLT